MALFEAKNVTKQYGNQLALDSVSISPLNGTKLLVQPNWPASMGSLALMVPEKRP
jgi:hypothetical protein